MSPAFRKALVKWCSGIAISTPTIALLQGAILLFDYRSNHGDAPRPDMPSRGVVVMATSTPNSHSTIDMGALRLLVIGDSLAAGVGLSKSSTPILPESIAQTLSSALGGRAVFWTCVGTPGVSASQIVQDIYDLQDMPTPLLQRLADWQADSRMRAKERLEATKQKAQEFLELRKQPVKEPVASNEVGRRIKRWGERVKRDLVGLTKILEAGPNKCETPEHLNPPHRRLTRRKTLDAKVTAEKYDVAIILTGLNDLKDSFLPFMMTEDQKLSLREARHEEEKAGGDVSLKGELDRVVKAARSRMKDYLPQRNHADGINNETFDAAAGTATKRMINVVENHASEGPLVVFPALPAAPIVVSRVAPLCWFMVPLFRAMDRNKEAIARIYPEFVLFVKSPDTDALIEAEERRGPLWENFRTENILLQMTDVASHGRDRVEELMRQHYVSWVVDAEDDDGFYSCEADSVQHSHEWDSGSYPGSSLISVDGIHPNDAGYNAWGRIIGDAITKRWASIKR